VNQASYDVARLTRAALIAWYLATCPPRICTCVSDEPPWCPGERYVFLGPQGGHFRRSNYSSRVSARQRTDGTRSGRAAPGGWRCRCWPI